jgi:TatD DNase family protein
VWTDSHCHAQWGDDLREVLGRSAAVGVTRAVMIGTDDVTSRAAVAAAAAGVDGVDLWATIGLHPHDSTTGVDAMKAHLAEVADGPGFGPARVVGIGECGLDYHYDHSPRRRQRDMFAEQIRLAHEWSLALVIHTREAWDDTFAILDAEGVPPRVVLHCFTGGPEEARECLGRGAYVSFSGIVTFPKAEGVQAAAVECPLGRMLIETDSPFLTPVPNRGKPNEPTYLPLVGRHIAKLKGLDESEVAEATSANTATVFGLS